MENTAGVLISCTGFGQKVGEILRRTLYSLLPLKAIQFFCGQRVIGEGIRVEPEKLTHLQFDVLVPVR